jgi:aryl-alcohol dehydrogenase-like predicted oxidoreductase
MLGGRSVSVIGLGTWQFGSREWGYGPAYASLAAKPLVDRALELGVNFFDTAEFYGFGSSERILGEALSGIGDDAVVATKLFPWAPVAPVARWSATASAKRLGRRKIDLYQLHFPNPAVPVSVAIRSVEALVESGQVEMIGVSNYSLRQWRAAEAAARTKVISNQVRLNLLDQRATHELSEYALNTGRVLIAYSPLAMGLLGGRYRPGSRPAGFRRYLPAFSGRSLTRIQELIDLLREIGQSYGATPAQVALAWVVSHPGVIAIPGASNLAQLESNAAAAEISLSSGEIAELSRVGAAVGSRGAVGNSGS